MTSVKPILPHLLNGQNASVFAYGPTGAGTAFFPFSCALMVISELFIVHPSGPCHSLVSPRRGTVMSLQFKGTVSVMESPASLCTPLCTRTNFFFFFFLMLIAMKWKKVK